MAGEEGGVGGAVEEEGGAGGRGEWCWGALCDSLEYSQILETLCGGERSEILVLRSSRRLLHGRNEDVYPWGNEALRYWMILAFVS